MSFSQATAENDVLDLSSSSLIEFLGTLKEANYTSTNSPTSVANFKDSIPIIDNNNNGSIPTQINNLSRRGRKKKDSSSNCSQQYESKSLSPMSLRERRKLRMKDVVIEGTTPLRRQGQMQRSSPCNSKKQESEAIENKSITLQKMSQSEHGSVSLAVDNLMTLKLPLVSVVVDHNDDGDREGRYDNHNDTNNVEQEHSHCQSTNTKSQISHKNTTSQKSNKSSNSASPYRRQGKQRYTTRNGRSKTFSAKGNTDNSQSPSSSMTRKKKYSDSPCRELLTSAQKQYIRSGQQEHRCCPQPPDFSRCVSDDISVYIEG